MTLFGQRVRNSCPWLGKELSLSGQRVSPDWAKFRSIFAGVIHADTWHQRGGERDYLNIDGGGGFEAAPLPARNFSMHRGWPFPWLHAPFLWARESYLLGDSDRSYNDPSLCTYAFLRRACNPGLHHYCLFNLDCWCFFFFFPRILSPVSARLHFWCSITSGFTILW